MRASVSFVALWVAIQAGCAHVRAREAAARVELVAAVDLPRGPETQELSATWYDAKSRTLYAVPDNGARLDRFLVAEDCRSFRVAPSIELTGRPSAEWDGEALARGPDGAWWVVAVERNADLERFSEAGAYLGTVAVPERFAKPASIKMGIESLSFSPSGMHLFIASEDALSTDGPIATDRGGTYVRILRRDVATGHEEQRAYLTDRAPRKAGATLGVSDVTALDEAHVLVLERGYAEGYGNTARIYVASFDDGADVTNVASLGPGVRALRKRLLVDLGALQAPGITNLEQEPNPILGNYEGLALGPVRPDGRRILFVTSDDNASPTQIARILVLAIPR